VYEPNVSKIMSMLKPTDRVLDIGGWASPFNRANVVLDWAPYETRGAYRDFGGLPFQGPPEEHFTRDSWVNRDICDHTPYPFADKSFDFVTCSHTLEDIRDPIWVVREIARVGKAGYVEVPSRAWEQIRDLDLPGMVGLWHHRWLVEAEGTHLRFTPKYHSIHFDPRYSFPRRYLRELAPEERVLWVFWDERSPITAEEVSIHGARTGSMLSEFVAKRRPPNPLDKARYAVHDRVKPLLHRVKGGIARRLLKGY
jgi:hypothetical protein